MVAIVCKPPACITMTRSSPNSMCVSPTTGSPPTMPPPKDRRRGHPCSPRAQTTGILPIQFALAGMNAHIENDLPLAVVATCTARRRTPTSPVSARTTTKSTNCSPTSKPRSAVVSHEVEKPIETASNPSCTSSARGISQGPRLRMAERPDPVGATPHRRPARRIHRDTSPHRRHGLSAASHLAHLSPPTRDQRRAPSPPGAGRPSECETPYPKGQVMRAEIGRDCSRVLLHSFRRVRATIDSGTWHRETAVTVVYRQ